MGGINVGNLTEKIGIIDDAFQDIVDMTSSLDPGTVLTDVVDVDKCAPIIIDPDPGPRLSAGHCRTPVLTVDRPVKIEDLQETIEKLKAWIHDIVGVIEELDQNKELPEMPSQP